MPMVPVSVLAFVTSDSPDEDSPSIALVKEINGLRYGGLRFTMVVGDILNAMLTGPLEPLILHQTAVQALTLAEVRITRIEMILEHHGEDELADVHCEVFFEREERRWSMPMRMLDAVGFSIASTIPIHIPEEDLAYMQEHCPVSPEDFGLHKSATARSVDEAVLRATQLPKDRLGNA